MREMRWQLQLAGAADSAECLERPVIDIAPRTHLTVVYLAYGDRYLEDLNDDPESEERYSEGLSHWAELVPSSMQRCALGQVACQCNSRINPHVSAWVGSGRRQDETEGDGWRKTVACRSSM